MTNPNDPIGMIVFAQKADGTDGSATRLGLSKKEHFAAMALQGLLSNSENIENSIKADVLMAVLAADLLIEELNKKKV